jgi:hypothetical protein
MDAVPLVSRQRQHVRRRAQNSAIEDRSTGESRAGRSRGSIRPNLPFAYLILFQGIDHLPKPDRWEDHESKATGVTAGQSQTLFCRMWIAELLNARTDCAGDAGGGARQFLVLPT